MKKQDGVWTFLILLLIVLSVLMVVTYEMEVEPVGNTVVPYANVNR